MRWRWRCKKRNIFSQSAGKTACCRNQMVGSGVFARNKEYVSDVFTTPHGRPTGCRKVVVR